ncbi:aldo/keto reductase [Flavivirga jejuensis]|uniref:Aldo/keto reductase n=1 Tax=Flavivirga jejuensis TaxID=870487 RepID=A0ABT8WPV8_9FLAO|nr:aldo/keto reductase [Flavivirga jejuensis]MDO5975202.1 aldo/keto reductase [Flavivirga jejuensis]
MLSLEELNKIGFGAYRISKFSNEHNQALQYAIDNGCNLIDTSSNYTNGESEMLIGDVISERRKHLFVITKAGYIRSNNEDIDQVSKRLKIPKEEIFQTSDNSFHSFGAEFLENEIKTSLKRLKTSYIDGFLLHNPEYYFNQNKISISDNRFYELIRKVFVFLETQVKKGKIRYYGISSNMFQLPNNDNGINLLKIIKIAQNISETNHFKFIQFPLNLAEYEPSKPNYEGKSLIEFAKLNGLITISNRTLTAVTEKGTVRFANYTKDISNLDEEFDFKVITNFLNQIKEQLLAIDVHDDILSFVPIQVVKTSWNIFPNTDVVDGVFNKHLIPFVMRIFDNDLPPKILQSLSNLKAILRGYAKRNMMTLTNSYLNTLKKNGTIKDFNNMSLSEIACKFCIDSGVDHVLVGMREKQYVESLKSLIK